MKPTILKYNYKQAQCYLPGRLSGGVRSIVLHQTIGYREGDIATLTGLREAGNVSVHWYIQTDGLLWHFVQDADTAYHVGKAINPKFTNAHAVGIELEGTSPYDYTAAQMMTLRLLTLFLLNKHNLQITDMVSHAYCAFPAGRKTDPAYFDWASFRNSVKNLQLAKTIVEVSQNG